MAAELARGAGGNAMRLGAKASQPLRPQRPAPARNALRPRELAPPQCNEAGPALRPRRQPALAARLERPAPKISMRQPRAAITSSPPRAAPARRTGGEVRRWSRRCRSPGDPAIRPSSTANEIEAEGRARRGGEHGNHQAGAEASPSGRGIGRHTTSRRSAQRPLSHSPSSRSGSTPRSSGRIAG
jgi:hypothetical protein